MTQFFSERQWDGKTPSRSRGFSTRQQGFGRAKRVYVCRSCQAWNEGSKKPAECMASGCMSNLFFKCDSKVEAIRFMNRWFAMEQGEIFGLKHHPKFDLLAYPKDGSAPIAVRYYEADTSYYYTADPDRLVVEDVKPKSKLAIDKVFIVKRAWFEAQYGIPIRIVN